MNPHQAAINFLCTTGLTTPNGIWSATEKYLTNNITKTNRRIDSLDDMVREINKILPIVNWNVTR